MMITMGRFTFAGGDGTKIVGWRNEAAGPPVLICNGLGTPPSAWPTVIAAESGFDVATWYYRGTAGGDRPADPSRITVQDHTDDAAALLDHLEIDRAVIACWSLGVNIGFELAQQHPDRVAGVLAVAGVPGGTFQSIGGPLPMPRRWRHNIGTAGARAAKRSGPAIEWTLRHIPLNRTAATIISHSGVMMPAATPERLLPMLEEFREHDFTWYFTLAVAGSEHSPMSLESIHQPVTFVAGRRDLITSLHDMVNAADQIPQARLRELPGSHFLPLEYPDELAAELRKLTDQANLHGA
jgi:pimeloyl-ACP methyl ester carboxylesterase